MSDWVNLIFGGCIIILAWALVRLNDKLNRLQERMDIHNKIYHSKSKRTSQVTGLPTVEK